LEFYGSEPVLANNRGEYSDLCLLAVGRLGKD
jgi:hypothetical protein